MKTGQFLSPEEFAAVRAKLQANSANARATIAQQRITGVPKVRTLIKKPTAMRDMTLLRTNVHAFRIEGDPWSYGPCVFPGQLCSKSNSRRLVMRGTKPSIIKSAESLAFVEDFVRCFNSGKSPNAPYEGPVCLSVQAYYQDRRRDLDVALLQDALQAAGIIKNDRQVVEIQAKRFLDKEQPRTWFLLTEPEE